MCAIMCISDEGTNVDGEYRRDKCIDSNHTKSFEVSSVKWHHVKIVWVQLNIEIPAVIQSSVIRLNFVKTKY